jgi:hypothetical protein
MALPANSGTRHLIQIRNHFLQTVGVLRRVISSSQGLYLSTGQYKQNKRLNTLNINALSGIRIHDPSVRANKDNSFLRPLGYCDRLGNISAEGTQENMREDGLSAGTSSQQSGKHKNV